MEKTMKRGLALFTATAMCLVLTACGENAIPEMTGEEVQSIGEYAAITMMKYDANHRSRLVDLPEEELQVSTVEKTPVEQSQTEESAVPEEEVASSEEQVEEEESPVTLTEAAGLQDGVTLDYTGYEICDQYPYNEADSYFSVAASAGSKLLVAKFTLTNSSAAEASVDFLSDEDTFRLTVNGNYTRRALTTMLLNDLSTYQGTLAPGESFEAVLVIEVEGDDSETVSSLNLSLKNESNSYTIQLQ